LSNTTEADDYPDRRYVAERARFVITLGALKAALEEEPNANAVRSCVRHWIGAATQVADEVIAEQRNKKKEGDQ
jgi:hypothetical protein